MDIMIEIVVGTKTTTITTERDQEVAVGEVIRTETTFIRIISGRGMKITIITIAITTQTKGPQIQICMSIKNMARPTLKRQRLML